MKSCVLFESINAISLLYRKLLINTICLWFPTHIICIRKSFYSSSLKSIIRYGFAKKCNYGILWTYFPSIYYVIFSARCHNLIHHNKFWIIKLLSTDAPCKNDLFYIFFILFTVVHSRICIIQQSTLKRREKIHMLRAYTKSIK